MKLDSIDYKATGQRLRACRIAASLKAEDVAASAGISRAAVYRIENGEIVKIETLDKLAHFFNTTLSSLLGTGTEYYSGAAGLFERMRQLESASTHIYAHFDPFSYLLTTDRYDDYLKVMLAESSPGKPELSPAQLNTLAILSQRKKSRLRQEARLFGLVGLTQIERFLHAGLVGTLSHPPAKRMERILLARSEVSHLIRVLEGGDSPVEIAVSRDPVPSLTFQIFCQQSTPIAVAVSPFRLGEFPNITNGVASVTHADEAIAPYRQLFNSLWDNSVQGDEAITLLKTTLERY